MTEKTLGQVLYEADPWGDHRRGVDWNSLNAPARNEYIDMAQAVAAVVREQAVMACEAQIDAIRPRCIEYTGHVHSIGMCIAAIRNMK